jgi:hypothetical protein
MGPGEKPRLDKVPVFTMHSMTPGAQWGAAGLGGGVAVSAMDASGAFTSPQTVAPKGGTMLAAVGPLDDSLVGFATEEGIVFAHGKGTPPEFTLDKPLRAGTTQIAFDPIAGRALLAWSELPSLAPKASDAPGPLVGTIVQNGSPVQTVNLGSGYPINACLSRRHGFVATSNSELIRFDATGASPMEIASGADLDGCGAGGALLSKVNSTSYVVCDEACRVVELEGARPSEHAALAADHVISIAIRERVLAVWSEKSAPAFYRLPEKIVPRKVISDGKTIDVIGESATENKPMHYVIARVPAT